MGGEQQFEEKRAWISRKRRMREGTLCKYQQAHYHFKTLERKSQKVERSVFLDYTKFILTLSISISQTFLSHTHTYRHPSLFSVALNSSLLSHFSVCDFYFCAHLASDFTCSVCILSWSMCTQVQAWICLCTDSARC